MPGLQVPHTHHLSLSIGSSVIIKGAPALSFSNDPQMQVDLHTGTCEDSDIALHFRVYFGRWVVMNSRKDRIWQTEERSSHVPFVEDQPFELRILVLNNEYEIIVNGQHCYSFGHRLHPGSVKMIQVWRDISLTAVDVS